MPLTTDHADAPSAPTASAGSRPPLSEARLLANRANALRSTGPRTEAGKAVSRANAYRHGMAGDGVVLVAADEGAVEAMTAALTRDFRPSGPMAQILVRRAAVMAVRLDGAAGYDQTARAHRARHADEQFLEARAAEVEAAVAALEREPARSVRTLRRTPEGLTRLIALWRGIEQAVAPAADPFFAELAALFPTEATPGYRADRDSGRWDDALRRRAEGLLGRLGDDPTPSRLQHLTTLIEHDPSEPRRAWAFGEIERIITDQIADLETQLAARDPADMDHDRAGAAGLAWFDPGREATLARRYEAAAERTLFRALRELGGVAAETTCAPPVLAPADFPDPTLGSFRAPSREAPPRSSTPARPYTHAEIEAIRRGEPLGSFGAGPLESTAILPITASRPDH